MTFGLQGMMFPVALKSSTELNRATEELKQFDSQSGRGTSMQYGDYIQNDASQISNSGQLFELVSNENTESVSNMSGQFEI